MDLSLEGARALYEKILLTLKHWQFSSKKQLAFLEDLYLLINDGIPANRAVEMMSQVSKGINRDVAESLASKIAQGQPLAEGMKEWFSMNVVEIVRVGEAGGALGQTMKSAINMLSQQGASYSAFVGAVSYPLVVIGIGCIMTIYLNNSVFGQFRLVKPVADWPESGRRLVAIAGFIQSWWWTVIVSVIGVVIALRWVMANYVGEFRTALDSLPPFSFYRQLIAARLLETLGLLVANGVVFKSAIKVMQYQANPYLSSHLSMMEHLLAMGKTNIADVLDTGLVSEPDLMRLRVMAEVKGFEHGLIRMGIRGTEQVTATLKLLAKIIGGIFLAIGGILIVMIIQGVYLTGMAMGSA